MNYRLSQDINHPQNTINKEFIIEGLSVINQKKCQAKFLPSEANTGIVFKINNQIIPARYEYLDQSAEHTTNLQNNHYKVISVEHLLSAIWGLGIDNIIVELSEDGIPFTDFSAKSYTESLIKAGIKNLTTNREYLVINKEFKITVHDDDRYAIFYPNHDSNLIIDSVTDFPDPIGEQKSSFILGKDDFIKNIAWARSFMRSPLDDSGAKWQRVRTKFPFLPADPNQSPLIVYSDSEYITPIKEAKEPSKHKVLDFIGDISLLQKRIIGKVFLYKPGHKFTHAIVKELSK